MFKLFDGMLGLSAHLELARVRVVRRLQMDAVTGPRDLERPLPVARRLEQLVTQVVPPACRIERLGFLDESELQRHHGCAELGLSQTALGVRVLAC